MFLLMHSPWGPEVAACQLPHLRSLKTAAHT